MSENESSPFMDQPSRVEGAQTYSKQKVARLEYELASMKTEKRLLEQSKESCVARYESLLTRKNEELAQLQSNFDFVYKQRKELESKVKNKEDVVEKSGNENEQMIKSLMTEKRNLSAKVDKYERQLEKVVGKCEHLRSDLNLELSANDQYRDRIKVLEAENKDLSQLHDNMLQSSKQLKSRLENDYIKKNEELTQRLQALQNSNTELQQKYDSVLQQKTSVEILKQKNASLIQKLTVLDTTQHRVSQLEVEKAELQAKFDEFFGMINATVKGKNEMSETEVVTDFVQAFKQLQNKNLVLVDKFNESQSEINQLQQNYQELKEKTQNEYIPQISSLKEELASSNTLLEDLKKTKLLNGKEIEFLRQSLKDMDEFTSKQRTVSSSPTSETTNKSAMNLYLTNLEKLVDDYKQEIEALRKDTPKQSLSHSIPTKRPRLVDEEDLRSKTANMLRKENLELESKLKSLQDECHVLTKKLSLNGLEKSHPHNQILELRSNPLAADQLIKQETLQLLRKENMDLIAKFVNEESVDSIPKSLFARQENDKEMLQRQIDQLVKKINRLKSVYAEKSRDIVAIISRFFGYSIEFIPSPVNPNDLCSKIKLVSKYTLPSKPDASNPYLIIDVHSRSLKAHGNFEFKTMCEELVDRWVSEKRQIPCFLSALTLMMYEDHGNFDNILAT